MQVTRETTEANLIRAWEPGRLRIGERWLAGHVIVSANRVIETWAVDEPNALGVADLQPAIDLNPTIVVLGTGSGVLLPDIEHRRVVAALFNPPARSAPRDEL